MPPAIAPNSQPRGRPRCAIEIARNLLEIRNENEDRERQRNGEIGNDEREPRVDEVHVSDHQEQRDDECDVRDDARDKDRIERCLAAAEMDYRDCIGGRDRHE